MLAQICVEGLLALLLLQLTYLLALYVDWFTIFE